MRPTSQLFDFIGGPALTRTEDQGIMSPLNMDHYIQQHPTT